MERRNAKEWDRGWSTLLPIQGRSTIDPPVVPISPIILTFNLIHSSCGVTWDDDKIDCLMVIFEETYIQIPKKVVNNALKPSFEGLCSSW